MDWNPQGARRRGGPKKTWKRTVLEEAGKCSESWREVKRLAGGGVRWRCFQNGVCSEWREGYYIAADTATTITTTATTSTTTNIDTTALLLLLLSLLPLLLLLLLSLFLLLLVLVLLLPLLLLL